MIILDCYTDEPSGLGVPPYLGTYPRYLYGALIDKKPFYLTIDDLRAAILDVKQSRIKTNIKINNLTRDVHETKEILKKSKTMIISGGIQTPGKYLSAVPGTFHEIHRLTGNLGCKKILVGPAAKLGTRLEGGRKQESIPKSTFDAVEPNYLGIDDYDEDYGVKGAGLLEQIPYPVMIELELGRGCNMKCSFCTEPLKHRSEQREPEKVIEEMKALKEFGAEHFRLGKATCFYSYGADNIKKIFSIKKPKTLHIDNANPNNVTEEITKLIVKHCTPGNVAAFGVESFDKDVISQNKLNCSPERALEAIRTINKFGRIRGRNGMPAFLPGINLLFGLIGETKQTHEENMKHLNYILDEDLLLRRINIRQVVVFKGTYLEQFGLKFLKKNKKFYWRWRNDIRQNIDLPMLKKVLPKDTVVKDIRMEVHDGNNTFGRQFGTYPLIVGIKEKLELKSYDVRITDHMLRSVTGVVDT